MSVRAKFVVESKDVTGLVDGKEIGQVSMRVVTSGSKENERFYYFTPSGTLKMGTVNAEAFAEFEANKEYYLDFSPADGSTSLEDRLVDLLRPYAAGDGAEETLQRILAELQDRRDGSNLRGAGIAKQGEGTPFKAPESASGTTGQGYPTGMQNFTADQNAQQQENSTGNSGEQSSTAGTEREPNVNS